MLYEYRPKYKDRPTIAHSYKKEKYLTDNFDCTFLSSVKGVLFLATIFA